MVIWKIVTLRKMLGMTWREFADALGVGYTDVWKWKTGKALPSRTAAILMEHLRLEHLRHENQHAWKAKTKRPKKQVSDHSESTSQPAERTAVEGSDSISAGWSDVRRAYFNLHGKDGA
jgi:transcriptional regulator with XRE-family HTH domain